jgi:hypothetical protein
VLTFTTEQLGFWDTNMSKVPRKTSKTAIEVTLDIRPVKLSEVTPTQRRSWQLFWRKLIAEVKTE